MKNLYQKIKDVMHDVAYLQKDGQIGFGNVRYKAITEEKVTQSVREALIKHGLVILPKSIEHLKEGQMTSANCSYEIVNTDQPEERESIVSCGTGVDTQDKGIGKALTYAYKYLLLRTFAIPTGDDPDRISSAEIDASIQEMAQRGIDKLEKEKELIEENPTNISQVNDEQSGRVSVSELRKRITDALIEMTEGNVEAAKDLLVTASSFEKDGEKVKGVSSTAKLTGKWLKSTYGRVKEMSAEYNLFHNTPTQEG